MKFMQWSADYYKALFEESFRIIEPSWQAEASNAAGYRWMRNRHPFREEFRIEPQPEGRSVLSFSLLLPELYRDIGLGGEFQKFKTRLQLSMAPAYGLPRLTAALQAGSERESLIEFIHQARHELTTILSCAVRRAQPAAPQLDPLLAAEIS